MGNSFPRLLVVEDDAAIRAPLLASLRAEDFHVGIAVGIEDARLCLRDRWDLMLLDLGLPDGNGLTLCRELQATGESLPIIVLTARDTPEDRVQGLEAGADDYVVKPFHFPELVARIRSVLRRAQPKLQERRLVSGELWLDLESRKAGCAERELTLKRREFDLLAFLMKHPGRAWTRDLLVERVWDADFRGDPRTVDLHIRRIRTLIEDDPGDPQFVQTVWGVGYRFRD